MNPKTITQYRSELTFNDNTTCSITGSDLTAVQDKIRKLLPGPKLKFEPSIGQENAGGSVLVFHDSHFNAQQPIGWIAAYEVPVNMSVKSVTETRLGQERAA